MIGAAENTISTKFVSRNERENLMLHTPLAGSGAFLVLAGFGFGAELDNKDDECWCLRIGEAGRP